MSAIEQQRRDYMIEMYQMQKRALQDRTITTVAVGQSEVTISLEGDEVPQEVWDGLAKMLDARIEKLKGDDNG